MGDVKKLRRPNKTLWKIMTKNGPDFYLEMFMCILHKFTLKNK